MRTACSAAGPAGERIAEPSRRQLARHAERLERLWGRKGIVHQAYACIDDKPLTGLGEAVDSFAELIEGAAAAAYGGASA